MHYPLHITLLLASHWILRDDVNAAKNGFSADVLTSFAKNVASVLSTTLLNEYQEPLLNQTSANFPKTIQRPQSSLDLDHNLSEGSEIPSTAYFDRYSRYTRQSATLNEGKDAYQDAYITDPAQYTKHYNPQAYPPYRFTVNPGAQIPYNQINAETPESIRNDVSPNSINADIKADSLDYSNRYRHPAGFRYKPEPVHPLPNPNRYPEFAPGSNYHRLPPRTPGSPEGPSEVEGIDPNEDTDENTQAARITRRPYHLNYHGPFHASYDPSFVRHPGFYPDDRPVEGEDQPVAPGAGQDENNPSRIVDDQSQGQSTSGGYEYGPGFHHGPPYHGGFYAGYPGFYPGPLNGTFSPGNVEQGGGNGTGPPPFGRPIFGGHRFGPYGPYHQPFYPPFYGHGRPVEGQRPSENQGNAEQMGTPENGQGDGNATANHPPFGFPPGPYGPYYGGYHFPAYHGVPFNGFPHRFAYGFHDPLYSRIKTVPYLNFHPGSFHHFPLVHFHPFGGYYPYNNNNNNNNNKPMMLPEKPAQPEKTVNENAEADAPPANAEVEMLSESMSEGIRSLPSNEYKARYSPRFITKESDKIVRRREFN